MVKNCNKRTKLCNKEGLNFGTSCGIMGLTEIWEAHNHDYLQRKKSNVLFEREA